MVYEAEIQITNIKERLKRITQFNGNEIELEIIKEEPVYRYYGEGKRIYVTYKEKTGEKGYLGLPDIMDVVNELKVDEGFPYLPILREEGTKVVIEIDSHFFIMKRYFVSDSANQPYPGVEW